MDCWQDAEVFLCFVKIYMTYRLRASMLSLSITFYFHSLFILHSDINYLSNSHISCSQKKIFLHADFLLPMWNLASQLKMRVFFNACLVWGTCCSTVADGAITDLWSNIFGWLSCSFSCSTFCFKFSLSWGFESLEPAACDVEKGGSAYFPWFFFTT